MVYDIDSVKKQNPIADVVARHGVALRETGSHLVGLCPFHKDKHPSLVVYPETRSFVRRADNLSFRDAPRAAQQRPSGKSALLDLRSAGSTTR